MVSLKNLNSDDRFIWYHKNNGNKEVYNVSNNESEILRLLNDYLIERSNLALNYNNFIVNPNQMYFNERLINDLVLSFSSSNLVSLFTNETNHLFNKFTTNFILTDKDNFKYINRLSDRFFYKSLINFETYKKRIRLVSMNTAPTMSTIEFALDPLRQFTTFYYGNENRFFKDDLSMGQSIKASYKDLLFIGDSENTTIYFPSTMTILDIDLEENFIFDENDLGLELQ